MKVLAVVLNWNGGSLNLDCVASLLDQGLAEADVVFVDNASTDGSLEEVVERHPGLCVLRNDENVGFGHGTNRGIEAALEAGAEAVLLVNNDVVLPEGTLAPCASSSPPAARPSSTPTTPRAPSKVPAPSAWRSPRSAPASRWSSRPSAAAA